MVTHLVVGAHAGKLNTVTAVDQYCPRCWEKKCRKHGNQVKVRCMLQASQIIYAWLDHVTCRPTVATAAVTLLSMILCLLISVPFKADMVHVTTLLAIVLSEGQLKVCRQQDRAGQPKTIHFCPPSLQGEISACTDILAFTLASKGSEVFLNGYCAPATPSATRRTKPRARSMSLHEVRTIARSYELHL